MIWKSNISLILLFVLFSCKNEVTSENKETENIPFASEKIATSYLIEAEELLSIYSEKNVKIVDFRKEKNYTDGHIEGAVQIWRDDFTSKDYPFGGMLPQPEIVENLFSSLGINNEDSIVVYDDRGSCDAVRFWWVMQYYNFKKVQVLNGGIDAWKDLNGAITTEKTEVKPSQFSLNGEVNTSINISKEEILKIVNSASEAILLDTRNIDEFSGKRQKKGASKGGRIPKSKLFDWDIAIDYSNNKKLKSTKELKQLVDSLQIKNTDTVITYCHSGVRSAHTYFVLKEILGYEHVYNYDGSWTEWSFFEELPFKKDSITVVNK